MRRERTKDLYVSLYPVDADDRGRTIPLEVIDTFYRQQRWRITRKCPDAAAGTGRPFG